MLDYIMYYYGTQIMTAIVMAIFGTLGFVVKNLVAKYLNDGTKQAVARTAVQFVEQVYKNLHGEEKLNAALERASELLNEKGIRFSLLEMETLIEAAVAEFNDAFYRPLNIKE